MFLGLLDTDSGGMDPDLFDFLSLKNDVNELSERNKQKTILKNLFFSAS